MKLSRPVPTSTPLTLFDMDGTLVDIFRTHLFSVEQVTRQFYNVAGFPPGLDQGGKPQMQFIREACVYQGVTESVFDSKAAEFVQALVDTSIAHLPKDMRNTVLPGVFSLLDALQERGALLGLVTGTVTKTVQAVLQQTGLEAYFPIRACGDDGNCREELLRKAISRATVTNGPIPYENITAIGDTIKDIQAARAVGIRVVSVATGQHPIEKLATLHPDGLLNDFSELDSALAVILKLPMGIVP